MRSGLKNSSSGFGMSRSSLKVEDPRDTIPGVFVSGAGDGDRTRGLQLGKLTPYHSATPARIVVHAEIRSDSTAAPNGYSSPTIRRRDRRNGPRISPSSGPPSPLCEVGKVRA